MPMTPAGSYIEANGLRVYHEAYGEGEPLLLIHGGTATSRSWASHLPAFTEHFRVFAPDSRGHGRTDNPAGELGYRAMADDAAALIKALGLQRPLVLGYSDGGQIALELGMRFPGLARALVLGGTQFRFSEAYLEDARALLGIADGEDEMDPEKLERKHPDWVASLREAHGHVYGPEYWKTYVRQIATLWLTPLRYTSEDLAAVTDPVLLLVGDRDGVATEESAELFRLLPDAELAVAPGSDHGFIEAKAGLFDALALDFLVRHRNDSMRVPTDSV
jgi:pimeloyl-ACP methyl ester carboxylesterase